jgi:ferredoxin-type protein NapF
MDPLAVFAGFFSVGQLGGPRVAVWAVAGLPAVLLISVVWPGQWCGRLCPLGGTQDLLALAVHWWRRGTRPVVGRESRRAVLAGGAGILLGVVSGKLWAVRRRELRPPGAVEEAAFEGGCIRCGSCSRVCPTGIIQPAVAGSDGTGFLAPRLRFSGTDYCLQDCNKCGAVCPTGVIRPLELAEKNRHVIGVAEVDLTECYLTLEKECGVCVARCPRAAIVDVFDYKTYHASVVVKGEMCNGCGACVGICPPRVIRVVGDGGPARRRAT